MHLSPERLFGLAPTPGGDGQAVGTEAATLVGSRYLLEGRIASGEMGEVWQATDRVLGRRVAVKILNADLAGDNGFRDRFRSEARAAARLTHPGVVGVYDYGAHESTLFLVMELVQGETVPSVLTRRGPLDAAETMSIVAQAASVLAAAQALGIVHRAVQPADLLVQGDGRVKISDLGLAGAGDLTARSGGDTLLGSLASTPPEQLRGERGPEESDVYSLGLIAYQCLTGKRPFDGDAAAEAALGLQGSVPPLPASVPAEVRRFVRAMLEQEPARRPDSAAAVAEAAARMAELLDEAPPAPQSPAPVRQSTRPRPRRPRRGRFARGRAAAAAVVAAVAAVAGGLVLTAGAAPTTVRVPNFRGQLERAATSSLAAAHLVSSARVVDVAGASAQLVVAQRPRAGTRVRPGTRVVLTVASGYVVLRAGSLDGLSYSAAVSVLRRDGLRAARLDSLVAGAGAGHVVAFRPSGRLKEGAVVALSLAQPDRRSTGASASPAPTSYATVDAEVSSPPPDGPGHPGHHPGDGPPPAPGHGSPGGPPPPPPGGPGNGPPPPPGGPGTTPTTPPAPAPGSGGGTTTGGAANTVAANTGAATSGAATSGAATSGGGGAGTGPSPSGSSSASTGASSA
jgi:tRNA A-37 threonylcarbamoyl transferase component Bud32